MTLISQNPTSHKITTDDLVSYLQLTNWGEIDQGDKWQVFRGHSDISGSELEIVLPYNRYAYDFSTYLDAAVNLLSVLRNEPLDVTIQRILNVDRDVLTVRNTDSLSSYSISLKLAARQVSKLQTIVRQSSNSERDALPYYRSNYSNSLADRMVNEFQFGHTQNRSFGLTIQSPVLQKPIEYKQMGLKFKEFESIEAIEPDAPIARRVVERIIRGLVATKNAVKQESVDFLVQYYNSGFSANMCKAIIDISRNKAATVEYGILWSPKIPPPEDITEVPPILLDETDYAYLSEAASELRELEPDDTFMVRGLVYGLSSTDDPRKLGVGQSVVVEWGKPDIGRIVKIIVELKPNEYIQAVHAHEAWQPIEVTGEAKLIGRRWRLFNPRDFRVVPKSG